MSAYVNPCYYKKLKFSSGNLKKHKPKPDTITEKLCKLILDKIESAYDKQLENAKIEGKGLN